MSRGIFAVAVLTLLVLASMPAPQSEAGPEEITLYSLTVFLDSESSRDYDYMTWDFGDGCQADSRVDSDAVNPVHTYGEPGTYTIVQKVFNGYSGGTEDMMSKQVRVMGPPKVTLMTDKGVFREVQVEDRTTRQYNAAQCPTDTPVEDGRTFRCWLAPDGEPYDWSAPVRGPLVLRAGWDDVPEPAVPLEPDEDDGGREHHGRSYAVPTVVGAGVLAAMAALIVYRRRA